MARRNIYVALHNNLWYAIRMRMGVSEPLREENIMSTKKVKPEVVSDAQAQVADQVASFAQKTVDQAQAAFEKVTEVAHENVQLFDAAANAYKNRVTDIQLKAMEFVQLNMNTGFTFARKFFAVRDPSEAFNLHQAFLKDQAETMQRQAAELGELSVALAKESLKPVQDTVAKSFASLTKPLAA